MAGSAIIGAQHLAGRLGRAFRRRLGRRRVIRLDSAAAKVAILTFRPVLTLVTLTIVAGAVVTRAVVAARVAVVTVAIIARAVGPLALTTILALPALIAILPALASVAPALLGAPILARAIGAVLAVAPFAALASLIGLGGLALDLGCRLWLFLEVDVIARGELVAADDL